MLILHAVQKLLNTSHIKPALYISEPSKNQEMHSWYVRLLATGFTGKLITMYVHEPSLLLVLCKGKTIQTTLPQFYTRLESLLTRFGFTKDFIAKELSLIKEGYIVSKTNSKSMLARINQMVLNLEINCSKYLSYNLIDLDEIEDAYINWLTLDTSPTYNCRATLDYWKEKGVVV
jgi:hypothetical protein